MLQVVFYCSKCVGTYISMRTDNKRKQQKNVSLANLLNFYCINKAHASKEISHVKLVVCTKHTHQYTYYQHYHFPSDFDNPLGTKF